MYRDEKTVLYNFLPSFLICTINQSFFGAHFSDSGDCHLSLSLSMYISVTHDGIWIRLELFGVVMMLMQ